MIKSLRLVNFKCFKDTPVTMRRLTVLSGANGVGKSSVIQALLLLRQTADQLEKNHLLNIPLAQAAIDIPVRLNGPYSLALGNTQSLTNTEMASDEMALSFQGATGSDCRFTYSAPSDVPKVAIRLSLSRENLSETIDGARNTSLFAKNFHYLVAERIGPREMQGVADQDFVSTGFSGEFSGHAIASSENAKVSDALCLPLENPSNLFQSQLEAWMDKIVPGVQISTRSFPEINCVRVGIRRKGSSTDYLSPANIGFGITYVLPVVVSGLISAPGSLFIVENPEAHLHPSAQSMIGSFLACVASAGTQVVVETHSEHVLNGIRLVALNGGIDHTSVLFNFFEQGREDATPVVQPISMDRAAELDKWPIGFFDQQNNDLAEMFRLRRVLRAN